MINDITRVRNIQKRVGSRDENRRALPKRPHGWETRTGKREEGKCSLKDIGREKDTRAEHETSDGSPGSWEVGPVCLGVSDTVALFLETI